MADDENKVQIERHQAQNIDVNTMDVMLGTDALSRTVIPCVVQNAYNINVNYVMNVYNIINNNTITLSGSLPQTEKSETTQTFIKEATNTNKRKRALEEEDRPGDRRRILISESKFKRMKKMENVDVSHYLVIKSDRVEDHNPDETKICEACEETYKLSCFIKSFTKKDELRYHYLKNVCVTCRRKHEKAESKKKNTTSRHTK